MGTSFRPEWIRIALDGASHPLRRASLHQACDVPQALKTGIMWKGNLRRGTSQERREPIDMDSHGQAHAQVAAKRLVGEAAAAGVETGMTVGLGTGSTVDWTLLELSRRIKQEGLQIRGVPTSAATAVRASALGIPLVDLDDVETIDLAIDGADQVDEQGNLIKGAGGAFFREKLVDRAADRFWVIVDVSKLAQRLGGVPVPVEIVPFGWRRTRQALEALTPCPVELRLQEGVPYVTDNGHYVVDCQFADLVAPRTIHDRLKSLPGVVETGLLVGWNLTVMVSDGTRIWRHDFAGN